MLKGLGHRAFIGSNNEQRGVDAANPGQHVLDESLVARDVDKAHRLPVGEREPGEAQVDGHRPRFLLSEAIRIDAGQRADKG